MTTAIATPSGLLFLLNFIEHHGDHTHNHLTPVTLDPTYLEEKGVTWHTTINDTETRVKLWTVDRDGNQLAEAEVDPNVTPFAPTFATLYDATLDVLSAGECE